MNFPTFWESPTTITESIYIFGKVHRGTIKCEVLSV